LALAENPEILLKALLRNAFKSISEAQKASGGAKRRHLLLDGAASPHHLIANK